MLLTAACLSQHHVQQKGFLVLRSKLPCVQSAHCSLVKWDLHLLHQGVLLSLCPSRFQQITGPVTSVTKEAALCQSKAGPAVRVLCEPGAQRFPRNLLPSLGRRVGQQLLLQLQSCAPALSLLLLNLRIQVQSLERPITRRRKENFERGRYKDNDYSSLTESNEKQETVSVRTKINSNQSKFLTL